MEKGKIAGTAGLIIYGGISLANVTAAMSDGFDAGKIDPAAAKMALIFASSVSHLMVDADEKITVEFEYVVGPSSATELYFKPEE